MARTVDDTLLPRPPQLLDIPSLATATRRAADRLEQEFNLSPEAAEALAASAVDPGEVRKAADNPERLFVPGGTLLGLRTRVWARRVMPDPRNPRIGPARRHPIALAPGTSEASRFRPIPEPDPHEDGRPELQLRIDSREHLSWASGIAKKFILTPTGNDWRLSIRNQGVMTEVWVSAVTLLHGDGTASITVPVTSEGSSRLTACHDILDIRSADVPYSRDDRALRSIIKSLNDAFTNGPTIEQAEALRCETVPALLLVGFEPNPGSTSTFATAVRSLVALRHVDAPKPWDQAAMMESIADAVLDGLADAGLITDAESSWLAGALTGDEADQRGFSADPAIRAARIVRIITDPNPVVQYCVLIAITSQSTRQRINNKFKLQVAAALIMRSVVAASDRGKVTDIQRAMRDGFSDTLASQRWDATYRPTQELLAAALKEIEAGEQAGPSSLELAARGAYPLLTNRQLWGDRGTKGNSQPDRRLPAAVIDRMHTSTRGLHQLGQALLDHAQGRRIRAVGDDGTILRTEEGATEQVVSDDSLRRAFPVPGRRLAPAAQETAHERLEAAISLFGDAMEALNRAVSQIERVDGLDGRPLIESEGVDPVETIAWTNELMAVFQKLPVWAANHTARHPAAALTAVDDDEDGDGDGDEQDDLDDEQGEQDDFEAEEP